MLFGDTPIGLPSCYTGNPRHGQDHLFTYSSTANHDRGKHIVANTTSSAHRHTFVHRDDATHDDAHSNGNACPLAAS